MANRLEMRHAGLLICAVGISGIGVTALAPELFALIGGERYQSAIGFLPILVLAQVAQVWYFVRVNQIFWAKRNALIPQLNAAAATVTVICSFALIPLWGGFGAAFASVAGAVSLSYLTGRTAQRVAALPLASRRFLLAASASATAILVLGYLCEDLWLRLLLALLAAALVAYIALRPAMSPHGRKP
jgi:O-antigen/teichoic acid export membrane protein